MSQNNETEDIEIEKRERMKSLKFMIIILLILFTIVLTRYFTKPHGELTIQELICITEKSELFVLKTCGHCENQKEILGEAIDPFKITECTENATICEQLGIIEVPTWIIDGEKYEGVLSLNKLKEISGC